MTSKFVQGSRQVGIAVGDVKHFTDVFEFFHCLLAKSALKIFIPLAGENPTATKTIRVNSTLAVDIVRASAGVHRFYLIGGEFEGKIHKLRPCNEQAMVIVFKIATFATRLTLG